MAAHMEEVVLAAAEEGRDWAVVELS
jgi:hypothetical protein